MDPRIQGVLAIIEADPHQKLSLVSLARSAGLSSSRLRHKFKCEVGVTPTAYVQNVRLKLAEELLKHGELSVKEVRAAIGLESDSYFTHLWSRVYGAPPSRMKEPSSVLATRTRTKF